MFTKKELVFTLSGSQTKNKVLEEISNKLVENGIGLDAKEILAGFQEREKQISTGMSDGIAIPHVAHSSIKEPKIAIVKIEKPVDWKAMDGKPSDFIIAIAVPESGRDTHMDLLTQLTAKLANEDFIKKLKEMNEDEIVKFINEFKVEDKKVTNKKGAKNVVGISTCPVGIAHTFMAAEAIENACAKKGYNFKIEKQAAIGTKDKLTSKDIEEADIVLFAAGKEIEGRERFVGKVGIEWSSVGKVIKEADKMLEEAETNPQPINSGGGSSNVTSTGGAQASSGGVMRHALAGLSYMIPFVVLGGIFIAMSMGLGYKPELNPITGNYDMVAQNSFWSAMNFVGVQGFTLMIPILAAFIANSIAGRSAIAPAAILSLAFNTGGGEATWNWDTMAFGGFTNSPALGFLGAIAFGYLVGYTVAVFNNKVNPPKWLAPAMPIFVIPLLFTTVFWIAFAFVGYLPLYGLALLLNNALQAIADAGLLPVLGLLLGAMLAFDMGGPINKIAFFFGVGTIATQPEIMGMVGAAGPVPPLGCALGVLFGLLLGVKFDDEDKTNATSAGLMGLIGISEGAIPFAIKYPKYVFAANMIGGAIAGMLAGFFHVTDVAAHTGPIVYLLGAVGHVDATTGLAATSYSYGLLFLLAIIIGSVVTGLIMAGGLKYEQIRVAKKGYVNPVVK